MGRLGFIYEAYEAPFYWWEVLEMSRKLLLTGAILFLGPGSTAQLAVAMLVASYYMASHIKCQPFGSDDDDFIQSVSLVSSVLTLTLALLLIINSATLVIGAYLAFVKLQERVQDRMDRLS